MEPQQPQQEPQLMPKPRDFLEIDNQGAVELLKQLIAHFGYSHYDPKVYEQYHDFLMHPRDVKMCFTMICGARMSDANYHEINEFIQRSIHLCNVLDGYKDMLRGKIEYVLQMHNLEYKDDHISFKVPNICNWKKTEPQLNP